MESTVTSSSTFPLKRSIHRVALACIQCRSRKVRCDAIQPACSRCRADEKRCEYQKSRRGGRPRRPVTATIQIAVGSPPSPARSFETFGCRTNSDTSVQRSSKSSTQSVCDSLVSMSSEITLPSSARLTKTQVDQLLTNYYTCFHASHPCVLPRWALETRIATEQGISTFVLPILLYIGSIFTHSVDSTPLASAAGEAMESRWLTPARCTPSPYFIQSLMLYSIAVYWCNEPERGRRLLDKAINGAFILGMHQKDFATHNGNGDPVLEESWRRTWWQLHVTDIHIAGSMRAYPGLSVKFPITTELPCEEQYYERGFIPVPASSKDYDTREFCDMEFSSFAHLIGFTQGISRVLAARQYNDAANANATCNDADTMMTAWCSLLPISKRKFLRDDGSVDELLFKANILMHTYIVDMHRRLSSLQYSAIESLSKCAPLPPPEPKDSTNEDVHIHTAKVLFAVEKLSSLLTLPTKFSTHTPFIICMIANMTIAHLSACRYVFREPELSLERDKIRLNMGVLKMLGEFWPAGQREYKTMGIIAKEILALEEGKNRIPQETLIPALDTLDYTSMDTDVYWAPDLFPNSNGPFLFDLSVGSLA